MTNLAAINILTEDAPSSRSALWQGAFWKVVSCACFAGINGVVRHLSGGVDSAIEPLPVHIMVVFQNAFGTLFMLPWIVKAGFGSLRTQRSLFGLHVVRVTVSVLGIYVWYLTLKAMPIVEGGVLGFTGPIFTVIGAAFFLQEKISFARLAAILLSLIGAFIISRPDIPLHGNVHNIGWLAVLPLSSAIAFAANKLLTRKLACLGETPTTLATYLLLFMAPVSLLLVFALFEWVTPSAAQWPWLILLGALAAGAHLSFSKAYQLAEVSFLMPIGFSKFFLNVVIGFLAFAEFPKNQSFWVGSMIIFLSLWLMNDKINYRISLYSIANRFKSN